jgi:hypothetical protein
MTALSDSLVLTDISIPGTHDTCTYTSTSSLSKCQTYNIEEQFAFGVRFFDLRVKFKDDILAMYHGVDDLNIIFSDVLTVFKTLLEQNPGEVILYRFMREDSTQLGIDSHTDTAFITEMKAEMAAAGLPFYDSSTVSTFLLSENRGRAICIEYNSKRTEDGYNMSVYRALTDTFTVGWSLSDFVTDKYKLKYVDVVEHGISAVNKTKFSRLELNATGGVVITLFGNIVTIPNPAGFVQSFGPYSYPLFKQWIDFADNNYLWFIDFEENYTGTAGEFYYDIIERNFVARDFKDTNLKLVITNQAPTVEILKKDEMAFGRVNGHVFIYMNSYNTVTAMDLQEYVEAAPDEASHTPVRYGDEEESKYTNLKVVVSNTFPDNSELKLGEMAFGSVNNSIYFFMNYDGLVTNLNITSLVL